LQKRSLAVRITSVNLKKRSQARPKERCREREGTDRRRRRICARIFLNRLSHLDFLARGSRPRAYLRVRV
jgi:hypothetical protein